MSLGTTYQLHGGLIMRVMNRLALGLALGAAAVSVPALAATSSAASTQLTRGVHTTRTAHVKPTLTAAAASFTIPAGSSGEWLLRLWTLPKPSTLEGHATGTSGTLTVKVPATQNCTFQVDVLHKTTTGTYKWYSGLIGTIPGCGGNP